MMRTTSPRSWWRNCALREDDEIRRIDRLEDRIAPLRENILKIRELISSLELCHHKAERWIHNILDAIGTGTTDKGPGTRPARRAHPVEKVWQDACDALSAWLDGRPASSMPARIGNVPTSQLLAGLGNRTPLKVWQIQRVREKINSLIGWPSSEEDPDKPYQWLLLSGGEYDSFYRDACPGPYQEQEEFWLHTARTTIHDTEGGDPAELSLALAVDMLWPCHWNFVENLRIVLDAVGGNLHPENPFAACGRNIHLLPNRRRMEILCDTLRAFYGRPESEEEADRGCLARLGNPTEEKRWLAASLEKTIRLQLDPPDDLRAVSAMTGPDWIKREVGTHPDP